MFSDRLLSSAVNEHNHHCRWGRAGYVPFWYVMQGENEIAACSLIPSEEGVPIVDSLLASIG